MTRATSNSHQKLCFCMEDKQEEDGPPLLLLLQFESLKMKQTMEKLMVGMYPPIVWMLYPKLKCFYFKLVYTSFLEWYITSEARPISFLKPAYHLQFLSRCAQWKTKPKLLVFFKLINSNSPKTFKWMSMALNEWGGERCKWQALYLGRLCDDKAHNKITITLKAL